MYIIYEVDTGVIRAQQSGSLEDVAHNLRYGEACLESSADITGKHVVAGELVDDAAPTFNPVLIARELRKGFLSASDWTQVPDSPLDAATKAAWSAYRQELRNFPANIADVAADQDRAAHVSSFQLVEALLPIPPGG